jgi:hypothetical protein
MKEFYINVISGLVGAGLVYLIQLLWRYWTERRAAYTGTWYGSIFDDKGQVVKADTFDLRQRGETISGSFVRARPTNQNHRKWYFEGKLRGREFFAIYWSATKDIQSYGCWYLTQADDDTFTGYYLSLQRTLNEARQFEELLKPIKLTLERRRPEPDSHR